MSEELTVKQIAEQIDVHLKRFESDPEINTDSTGNGLYRFYNARAYASGAWVRIIYISYQGNTALRKTEAKAYLDWLDAGNIGRHYAVK